MEKGWCWAGAEGEQVARFREVGYQRILDYCSKCNRAWGWTSRRMVGRLQF